MTLPGVSASPQIFSVAQLLGLISGQLPEELNSLRCQLWSLDTALSPDVAWTSQRWEGVCPASVPVPGSAHVVLGLGFPSAPLGQLFLVSSMDTEAGSSSGKLFSMLNKFLSWARNFISYQPSHFFLHELAANFIDTVSSSSSDSNGWSVVSFLWMLEIELNCFVHCKFPVYS